MDLIKKDYLVSQEGAQSFLTWLQWEKQVVNRAAHSVGCHTEDFPRFKLMDWYLKGMSQFEAARRLETDLQDEAYYSLRQPKQIVQY